MTDLVSKKNLAHKPDIQDSELLEQYSQNLLRSSFIKSYFGLDPSLSVDITGPSFTQSLKSSIINSALEEKKINSDELTELRKSKTELISFLLTITRNYILSSSHEFANDEIDDLIEDLEAIQNVLSINHSTFCISKGIVPCSPIVSQLDDNTCNVSDSIEENQLEKFEADFNSINNIIRNLFQTINSLKESKLFSQQHENETRLEKYTLSHNTLDETVDLESVSTDSKAILESVSSLCTLVDKHSLRWSSLPEIESCHQDELSVLYSLEERIESLRKMLIDFEKDD